MFSPPDKKKIISIKTLSVFFAIILLIEAILLIIRDNSPYTTILSDSTFIALNLFVIIILFYVAKESSKYGRKTHIAWILIAFSQVTTILGTFIWSTLSMIFNEVPSPSIADIFYLAYYPLLIIGILYLPVNQTNQIRKYQILLDTGILMVAVAMVLLVILITPISGLHNINTLSIIISSSYLFMDFFLLIIIFYLMFNWFGDVKRNPLVLLALSVGTLVITSIIFIYQFLYGIYHSGGLLDVGWLVSYFLTALAGISYINDEKHPTPHRYRFPSLKFNWRSYLPVLWLSFILILLSWIYIHPYGADSNLLIVGSGIIIIMVFARQVLALEESNQSQKLLQDNQEILKKREEHLALVTDNMMDLVTQIDLNGTYKYVSPSARKTLGYNPKSMLEKTVFDFIHPDDLERVKNSTKIAILNNSPRKIEYRYKEASGNYIWIENIGTPIFDYNQILKGFVCSSRNINDRKNAEEQIKASLEEKEVLLKEIHHRVKNNMQIISSLLSLQSKYVKDNEDLRIFMESQNRVRSMAMIHEHLYKTSNLARINLDEYIQTLVSGLFNSYGVDPHLIKANFNLDYVSLDMDKAISCGLIINELVSNSLKYAFPHNRIGEISLILQRLDDNELELIVADDGIGFPQEHLDFRKTESLGLQLVNALVDQIEGVIKLETYKGTKFSVNFKESESLK